jgi:hypothetical protein
VNLLQNDIGTDQAKVLVSIIKEHPTLKSLCGNKGDEAELDMSGKNMRAWDAIMLAAEIVDNGALSSLNLASNCLCGLDGDGDGSFDASGNACFHQVTQLTRACSHRDCRPCQCHPRYGGVDVAGYQ